jgi:hypothetical protein
VACEGGLVLQDGFFLQFPFMPGGNLEFWTREHPRSFYRKLDVFTQLSDAVAALHRHNVFHRDIKPYNVVMASEADDARPLLIDFESSKEYTAYASLTAHGGSFWGTHGFIPPEVMLAAGVASPDVHDPTLLGARDVFSFAVSAVAVLGYDAQRQGMPSDALQALDSVGGSLERHREGLTQLLRRCLLTDPLKRPSAAEVHDALLWRACVIGDCCGGDPLAFGEGVTCPSGQHVVCDADLAAHVRFECSRELAHRQQRGGAIECPACELRFDVAQLAPHMEMLLASNRGLMEAGVEREVQQRVAQELALSEVAKAKRHLELNILTDKCPNCAQAMLDFTSCCSVTCSRCCTQYCAFCFAFSAANAHSHVAQCVHNPNPGDVFCNMEVYLPARKRFKRQALDRYLRGLDVATRGLLLEDEGMKGHMRDLM